LPYAYDPEATAPAWERLLRDSFANVHEFLQEFAGYCLTILTLHELAVWLHGEPGGGKSTLITGFEAMLGNRAGVLGISDIERSGFMLTGLIGKTLVTATEQPSDYLAAMHKLNAIISGEPIVVDLKHKDPITITPTAKILWSMNDLPRVPDANNGIFRRVQVVHVPSLPPEQRDPTLKEAVKLEGAGILNWALEGLRRLQARGNFIVPESVKAETDEFKDSSDVEKAFLADDCHLSPNGRTMASKLYSAYSEWCAANGHKPKGSIRVARDWVRLGLAKKKTNAGTFYEGAEIIQRDIFQG
jgi:putative DNA primase/helicase